MKSKIINRCISIILLSVFITAIGLPNIIPQNYVVETNTQFSPESSGVPIGFIAIWSGSLSSIPSGWVLCNGSNGTPDLRNRFVVGIDNEEIPGTIGGQETHNHTYFELPLHTHTITDPGHTHYYDSNDFVSESAYSMITGAVSETGSSRILTTSTTGITIQATGQINCETENASSLPAYYKVAYIMKTDENLAVPNSIILAWNGSISEVPEGWKLCNGLDSTPNMTGRFLYGVENGENPGKTGDSSHNHTYTEIPLHNHTLNDPGHSHYIKRLGFLCSDSADLYDQEDCYTSGSINYIGSSFTGITIDSAGVANPTSTNATIIPPYINVAYIIKTGSDNFIPKSAIGFWTDSISSIPMGWSFCNGSSGTIDTRNRYLRGMLEGEITGITGEGSTIHNHTLPNIPLHTHGIIDPGHTHGDYYHMVQMQSIGYIYVPNYDLGSGSSISESSTTGITINANGTSFVNTTEQDVIPPYYRLAFIQCMNNPPEANNVVIQYTNALSNDTLIADYDYFDGDSDEETNSIIQWYRNDELQDYLTNCPEVPHIFTNKSDEWYFTITPYDGIMYGATKQSDPLIIENGVPWIEDAAINPTIANETTPLILSYIYCDIDGDENFTSIIWYIDNYKLHGFENETVIPAYVLNANNVLKAEIMPFDGQTYANTIILTITIQELHTNDDSDETLFDIILGSHLIEIIELLAIGLLVTYIIYTKKKQPPQSRQTNLEPRNTSDQPTLPNSKKQTKPESTDNTNVDEKIKKTAE